MVKFRRYCFLIKKKNAVNKKNILLNNKINKSEFSNDLFISSNDNIEENVLKMIKKDNKTSNIK